MFFWFLTGSYYHMISIHQPPSQVNNKIYIINIQLRELGARCKALPSQNKYVISQYSACVCARAQRVNVGWVQVHEHAYHGCLRGPYRAVIAASAGYGAVTFTPSQLQRLYLWSTQLVSVSTIFLVIKGGREFLSSNVQGVFCGAELASYALLHASPPLRALVRKRWCPTAKHSRFGPWPDERNRSHEDTAIVELKK